MPESITLDELQGVTWIHVDTADPDAFDWLMNHANLSGEAKSLLQLPHKVSRRDHLDEGLLVTLCGLLPTRPLERNPALSVALVIRENQVITVGSGRTKAIEDIRNQLCAGAGPTTPLELLASWVVAYHKWLEPLIASISEETDDLEDQVLTSDSERPMEALDPLRRKVFCIRRYLVATQNVLRLIVTDPTVQMSKDESEALTAATDFVARHVESLMDCQERALLLHDRIENQLSRGMVQATYNLTIVATVFLPLTFVTGLLGMNVAGIPESHDPLGFWVVVGVLIAIAFCAWGVLHWKKRIVSS